MDFNNSLRYRGFRMEVNNASAVTQIQIESHLMPTFTLHTYAAFSGGNRNRSRRIYTHAPCYSNHGSIVGVEIGILCEEIL